MVDVDPTLVLFDLVVVDAGVAAAHQAVVVELPSEPFVEYVHLARFGDRWLIVNALYYVLSDN